MYGEADAHLGDSDLNGLSRLAGRFIVLDGLDGGGKTSQIARLSERLGAAGLEVQTTRDPGGTAIGEGIRHLLLHLPDDGSRPVPYCELLLFMASRAQLVAEKIAPALARGKVVLGDRFIWSTLAYQAANGSNVDEILHMARGAIGTTWPDLTILLDVPPEIGMRRIALQRGTSPDAIEERSIVYRHKVRELFLGMPRQYQHPMAVVDATADFETVHAAIIQALLSASWVHSPAVSLR